MLAKLIAYGETRDAAIDRLGRALRDYVILGTKTNISWLRRVVTHPAFRDGRVSTRFLEDHDLTRTVPDSVPDIAAAIAARARRPEGRVVAGAPTLPTVWDALGGWGR